MKLNSQKIFARLVDNVLAHPKTWLITAGILTILAIVTIVLKADIRSDVKYLMPQDAKVVQDIASISDRMGSVQTLAVYLKIPELKPLDEAQKQSPEYQACLASLGDGEKLLRPEPPVGENWCDNALMLYARDFVQKVRDIDSIGNVGFQNDKTFFEDNILLYASNDELQKAYDEIDKALTEARRMSGEYKACLITANDESECDDLKPGMAKTTAGAQVAEDENGGPVESFKKQLIERYEQTELAAFKEFPFYAIANGGWMVALEIRFKDSTTGLQAFLNEIDKIENKIADIDADKKAANIEIEYGGGLIDMKAEYHAVITDIVRSISITILSIMALLAIFFMSIRAALRIFGPILMSTICALGITFLTIGYLNLITAFIFAILIGLGIDFGIHLYARYNLERRLGHEVEKALRISVIETGSPLFFGALTTAAAFFTLMLGSFPGFSQFGFVAGIGVILAFLTMTTVMPALVLCMERVWPSKMKQRKPQTPFTDETKKRMTPWFVTVSLLCLGCGIWCATQVTKIQFEDNFYNLQLKEDPKAKESKPIEMKTYTRGLRPSSPTVVILDNLDQVEELGLLLKRDEEYRHFRNYQRTVERMPNVLPWISYQFGDVLPYLGQNKSIPMMTAIMGTFPQGRAKYNQMIPLYVTYGYEKSQALRLYRDFAMHMPNTASRLAGLMPEVYQANRVANALPWVVKSQQQLPEWLWPAIPTQRSSQQLNTISDYASIFSFLPGTLSQQQEKLQTIAKIAERTADRQIRFLPEKEKQSIRDFRKYLVTETLNVDNLPEWVKLQFKESGNYPLPPRPESGVDYAFGNVVLLYQTTSTYKGIEANVLVRDTRSIRIDDKPVTASTGAFVYADMLELVKTDGMQIAIVALIVILLIAVIQQRNPFNAMIVTFPVISGLMITVSVMIFFDLKLGLFNIVMLPVILGIGIDGSIYLLQRYQRLGRGAALEAVRAVIGPVFMSSFTTLVGFGGMVMSQHMGLNSMGLLAILGISCCFATTFVIQPGLILIAEKLKLPGCVPDYDFKPENLNKD